MTKFMGFKCTVIDFPGSILSFKKYYEWAGFETIGANIDDYTFSDSTKFDIIMSLENIEHINAAPSEYIAKFIDLLAQGGYFVISTPNMGSFAHVFRILAMMPTLPVPEKTFDRNSHVHYREYMPCEIVDAYEKNGLVYRARAYSNESQAFRKYNTSRRSLHHVKNRVLSSVMRWSIQPLMALIGVIPRFRYDMIIAAQKV
ncbi:MAG: methyltransferase domain-containing protein [Synergistaceae bacterium]|nr:methyltransferase domain-containing protein [Synergistaceae bacterium]